MNPKADNDGIWIEGSATVNAGAMAAGKNATAIGITNSGAAPADLDELRKALSELVMQLRSTPAGIDDPAALAVVAVSAQREAGKSKPNKRILGGLLQALRAGVADSAAIANMVVAIQHAVSVLL
jgi:hypothetical protein